MIGFMRLGSVSQTASASRSTRRSEHARHGYPTQITTRRLTFVSKDDTDMAGISLFMRRSPAGDRLLSCPPKTSRGGLRRISPSCRSCWVEKIIFGWPIGPGCWRSFGRAGRRFQCSSCPLATPGIFYKPVSRVRHQTIGILRCCGLLYRPFWKEHARDRMPLLA
jgi:hypothetical protein